MPLRGNARLLGVVEADDAAQNLAKAWQQSDFLTLELLAEVQERHRPPARIDELLLTKQCDGTGYGEFIVDPATIYAPRSTGALENGLPSRHR
ncbi:hypothetical protein FA95DRAFT_1610936 [Auriscalpium vulgare]|uniref:Uncharacterized protein n=1 Tax=Auriscalpium vulgare TaxID=40419 RepID=A0ACB8RC49_9AGAM|nr:hypothetical protein FA95DRAFT_1610936 [Auriscalpium vulgare]